MKQKTQFQTPYATTKEYPFVILNLMIAPAAHIIIIIT